MSGHCFARTPERCRAAGLKVSGGSFSRLKNNLTEIPRWVKAARRPQESATRTKSGLRFLRSLLCKIRASCQEFILDMPILDSVFALYLQGFRDLKKVVTMTYGKIG